MPADNEAVISAWDLNNASSVISDPEVFQRTANTVDNDAFADVGTQQKLRQVLRSPIIQLRSDVEIGPQDKKDNTDSNLVDDLNLVHQPEKHEHTLDDQVKSEGIRFVTSKPLKPDKLLPWVDPRRDQTTRDIVGKPYWLTVNKVTFERSVSYEITISDEALRDCIREHLSTFIAHRGQEAWHRDEVILKSDFETLVFNLKTLSAIANEQLEIQPSTHSSLTKRTRSRLGQLLEILPKLLQPSILNCMNHATSRDFRVEIQNTWPLFCPGKLIVANTRGFELPQLMRIDDTRYLITEHGLGELVVSAWMWDWDGQRLVRSMFEFRKSATGRALTNPREWDFYPVEFYEAKDGNGGMEALLQNNPLLRDRRWLFIEYAIGYSDVTLLRYSGDALGDMTAFEYGTDNTTDWSLLDLLGFRKRPAQQRLESKLIKLDEDIILDIESYRRRVGSKRRLADWKPVEPRFCHCKMCMDQDTKCWYEKMDAISKAGRTDIRTKIKEALDMPVNENDLLLPPRVFGFALNRKEWCQFSLEKIQRRPKLDFSDNGASVEGLVFPSKVFTEERQDIFKLVSSHKRVMSYDKRFRDTINGKGESLILLFHGHSGTGKTLYAESLAKACELGLFRVGTHDIGLDIVQAERRLKEMFELAELWNAILLIDEADVLLDARGRENESLLSKNGLVSVLLREVEYFRGILIMTTNRVRAFDPAILSRIHHAVDFEGPTLEQEKALWDLWYKRMEKEGVCGDGDGIRHWIEKTTSRKKKNFLSGREVRNVFLTAQSLAEDEGKGIKIGVNELERAYQYKFNFLDETAGKLKEAKAMVMSGMTMD